MPRRESPPPAYWEWCYIQIAVTLACAVIVLLNGGVTAGLLLLGAVAVEAVVLTEYRRRSQRG